MTNTEFSILIPTWNNLPYLEICIDSIRKNSRFQHQVIVYVNEGADGTTEWLKKENIEFIHNAENAGICIALNQSFMLAKNDYIVYLNDDMYCCPGWDFHILNEIENIGHTKFFLSATMIEPVLTPNSCVLAPYDFGRTADTFREKDLLKAISSFRFHDWSGSTWPPSIVHRSLWEKVGGLSEEFSPGMYSDPDFSMKLWNEDVRYFKGIGNSFVYHFMSKSTGKVKRNDGRKQFLKKWGVSSSWFTKKILHSGEVFKGELPGKKIRPTLKDRLKKLFA
jgi:glycosyltransferase involved in cell wall biosynthesis